jgi:cell division protein FtsA
MVPSTGMRKGVVVDIASTSTAIRSSVDAASRMARVEVGTVYVGVTGAHIESRNNRGLVQVGQEVTEEHLQQARLAARQVPLSSDREILHSIPRQYVVDGQEGIRHPVGMSARTLELETHLVTAASAFVENVVKCVRRAHLEIEALVVEPLATGLAVLTGAERQLGVVLADIGGGTTDVALFVDGAITHTTILPIGGTHLTNDLAIAFRMTPEDAERVKVQHGAARGEDARPGEYVEIQMVGEDEPREIPRALLTRITEPRMAELFELLSQHLEAAGMEGAYASTCVLSGGGAQLPGCLELAQQILQLPVRLGAPREVLDPRNLAQGPIFATAVGMLHYAAEQGAGRKKSKEPQSLAQSTYRLVQSWLRRLRRGR